MSVLTSKGLPEEIHGMPISPDFRNILNIHEIFLDETLQPSERFLAALLQLYPEIPDNAEQAFHDMLWFIRRGKEMPGSQNTEEVMNYNQDADLIYSSFMSAYGMRLSEVEYLHYWEFLALLEGLPEDTIFKKVVYWRTADLTKVSKEERAFISKMRRLYALKKQDYLDEDTLSIEELQQRALDRANRRMAEVKEKVEKTKEG